MLDVLVNMDLFNLTRETTRKEKKILCGITTKLSGLCKDGDGILPAVSPMVNISSRAEGIEFFE